MVSSDVRSASSRLWFLGGHNVHDDTRGIRPCVRLRIPATLARACAVTQRGTAADAGRGAVREAGAGGTRPARNRTVNPSCHGSGERLRTFSSSRLAIGARHRCSCPYLGPAHNDPYVTSEEIPLEAPEFRRRKAGFGERSMASRMPLTKLRRPRCFWTTRRRDSTTRQLSGTRETSLVFLQHASCRRSKK
jgi:hypothetical protein